MPLTTNSFYKSIVLQLKALYPAEEARSMADRVFDHFLFLTPAQRVLTGTNPVEGDKTTAIQKAISRLLKQEPLQYVLGKAYFLDMEFEVNPSVLIPRPETEELVSMIIESYSGKAPDSKAQFLDIGTGSGCIAIGLKHNFPDSRVSAIDISDKAIQVAAENAAKNNAEINFIEADILDPAQWHLFPQCNLVVSNPPYVTRAEKHLMLPNVLEHEPHTALFVPNNDPLIFYRAIFAFAKTKLLSDGSLWFEINEMFGKELNDMAIAQGFTEVNIIFDFKGKSRFLHCRKVAHQYTSQLYK